MLAVRLPREIEERLERLARKTGRSKSHYAREAIVEYLEDLEDFYLAEERIKRFRDARSIPLDDLIRRHDVAD
jgi:RHH-type rel operon transcriptional repressor/antitoxin RelB